MKQRSFWQEDEEPGFQLAPMIDVVFILLIFYVVISLYTNIEAELGVQVPTSKNASREGKTYTEIVINVLKDGSLEVNQIRMTPAKLQETLQPIAQTFPDGSIIIRGDREAAYEAVFQVLDICSGVGLSNVSFAANEAEEQKTDPENNK